MRYRYTWLVNLNAQQLTYFNYNFSRIFILEFRYSRTTTIRTPIIRNAYYPNTTLTKEIRTWQEALERQLRLREKMRPKTKFETKKKQWLLYCHC